jgi:type VI secretion system protein ImpK
MNERSLQSYQHAESERYAPANVYGNGYPSEAHGPDNAQQAILSSINELVRIVTPLITLITQIRYTTAHPNVAGLRAQIVEEIKIAERKLADARYTMRTIIATRYCLCTAIDEAVLSQDWGTNSIWVSGSLLSIFQKETWGGERFYIILEDALRDTHNNIDFIEFAYFLMSLGFEGRYYGEEQRGAREEIRNRVFYYIRHARMKPERNLSLRAKNHEAPDNLRQRKANIKKMAIISGIAMLILAIFYNARVYHAANPIIDELNQLANVEPNVSFSQIIERPVVIRSSRGG